MPIPRHLRPKREKLFGPARGTPLDRNAKTRIIVYARAWSARHKQPGQHRGPLTRATIEVLQALLFGFHNAASGLCFPSYEAIALKADCARSTVSAAIVALEDAAVLSWVNRIIRERVTERDLFGRQSVAWRLVRTSNAYVFRDPLPCHERAAPRDLPTSENPSGTANQDTLVKKEHADGGLDLVPTPLLRSLHRLGSAIAARDAAGLPA